MLKTALILMAFIAISMAMKVSVSRTYMYLDPKKNHFLTAIGLSKTGESKGPEDVYITWEDPISVGGDYILPKFIINYFGKFPTKTLTFDSNWEYDGRHPQNLAKNFFFRLMHYQVGDDSGELNRGTFLSQGRLDNWVVSTYIDAHCNTPVELTVELFESVRLILKAVYKGQFTEC